MTIPFHVAEATAEPLLQRLDGLQRSGTGWRARCPACSGRSRKLSVTERDGRVLVHCFGGCPAEDVLSSVGLVWADVMPPRHWPESAEDRRVARRAIREAGWAAALSVLAVEAKVVLIASHEVAAKRPLPPEDEARLAQAVARIDHATAVLTQPRPQRPGVPA